MARRKVVCGADIQSPVWPFACSSLQVNLARDIATLARAQEMLCADVAVLAAAVAHPPRAPAADPPLWPRLALAAAAGALATVAFARVLRRSA